ncbi:hypothetical protein CLOSTASPAR_00767 [[Clostridium] asparagiforme DSM 15981]|uniref:Uncharacterized protein n=1 Tax=[Clostridium] asparagiforme DSM 15981 TaxID=518636 RepID=C0CUS5_9FIRM|nr:hypothetical protein CLOSTASPAR_00767 [[Clostridium] asparagiforme DSM 15981]
MRWRRKRWHEGIKIHNRKNGSRQTAGRAAALLLFCVENAAAAGN